MTLLAGLGISATGALVVFGALTGRLAAIIAAVVKPSDLAPTRGGPPLSNLPVAGFQQDIGVGTPKIGQTVILPNGKKAKVTGETVFYYDSQGRAYSDPDLKHRVPSQDLSHAP